MANLEVSKAMIFEAERGLKWRKEYNRGGTEVGVRRARSIIADNLTEDDWIEINAWHARHASDANAEGYRPGEKGFPSAGRIANALWGGRPGRVRAERIAKQIKEEREENEQQD